MSKNSILTKLTNFGQKWRFLTVCNEFEFFFSISGPSTRTVSIGSIINGDLQVRLLSTKHLNENCDLFAKFWIEGQGINNETWIFSKLVLQAWQLLQRLDNVLQTLLASVTKIQFHWFVVPILANMSTLMPLTIATTWISNLDKQPMEWQSQPAHLISECLKLIVRQKSSLSIKNLSSLLFMFLGDSDMLAPSGCTQWFTGAGPAHVSFFLLW